MQIITSSTPIQKYVRLPGNEIIFFPRLIEHFSFKHLNPVTAGLCIIDAKKRVVNCFGLSITLHLESDEENDSKLATRQVFGDNKK